MQEGRVSARGWEGRGGSFGACSAVASDEVRAQTARSERDFRLNVALMGAYVQHERDICARQEIRECVYVLSVWK